MEGRFAGPKGTTFAQLRANVKNLAGASEPGILRAYFQVMKGQAALVMAMVSVAIFAQPAKKVIDLKFSELIAVEKGELKHSDKAIQASGKRVRLTGFMAHMEAEGKGGFWLTKRPVFQDESGAGTGELPPNAVYVSVRSARNEPVSFIPRPISVTGIFKIAKNTPQLSLVLDNARDLSEAKPKAGAR